MLPLVKSYASLVSLSFEYLVFSLLILGLCIRNVFSLVKIKNELTRKMLVANII